MIEDNTIPLVDHSRAVRAALQERGWDGWLLYDFRRSNPLACQVLGIAHGQLLTRRFFYWWPCEGEPVKIVHAIEPGALAHLPGYQISYCTWQELEAAVASVLTGKSLVAMEYVPRNANPYLSLVDGGTLDLVRGCGPTVVSSADLLLPITGVLSKQQQDEHLVASLAAVEIMASAWQWIGHQLRTGEAINEWDVQHFILEAIQDRHLTTEEPPLCAVNAHSADPHYVATKASALPLQRGDVILIDLGCKVATPTGVYADITHMGIAAPHPTVEQQAVFNVVKAAREAAMDLIRDHFATGKPLRGCDVDDYCRRVITAAGFGAYFIHRTGHNIGTREHGDGTHLDNFETQDQRLLLPGTCFSIEPGIYLPGRFGVRLEHNVLIQNDGTLHVTGAPQSSWHGLSV